MVVLLRRGEIEEAGDRVALRLGRGGKAGPAGEFDGAAEAIEKPKAEAATSVVATFQPPKATR